MFLHSFLVSLSMVLLEAVTRHLFYTPPPKKEQMGYIKRVIYFKPEKHRTMSDYPAGCCMNRNLDS